VATIRIGCDLGRTHARAVAVEVRERRHEPPELRILAAVEAVRDAGDGERPMAAVAEELVDRLGRNARGRWTVVSADLPLVVKVVAAPVLDAARTRRLLRLELEGLAAGLSGEGPRQDLAADAVALPAGDGDPLHLALATDAAAAGLLLAQLAKGGVREPRLAVPAAVMANLVLPRPELTTNGPVLFVDIGRDASAVALVGPAVLIGCRVVAIGGQAFTEALAGPDADPAALADAERRKLAGEGMAALFARPIDGGGDRDRSDDLLFDDPPAATPAPAPAVAPAVDLSFADDPPPAPAPVPAAVEPVSAATETVFAPPGSMTQAVGVRMLGPELARAAETLYLQIATTLAWIKAQSRQTAANPSRIVLTGGGARLFGLAAYLERRFSVPVAELDPCEGVAGRPADHGGIWAMALAGALADSTGAVAPDLTPEGLLRQRAWTRELVWPYVAAGLLAVSGALLAWDLSARAGAATDEIKALKDFSGGANQRLRELEAQEAVQTAMQADLRSIAGRIYAGRDLLDVLQAAKRQAKEADELWLTSLRTILPDPALAAPAPDNAPRDRFTQAVRGAGRSDATVDRGGVELSGYVRFDSVKTYEQIVAYFDTYYLAIRAARGITGEELFIESEVRAIDIKRDAKVEANSRVPFTIRLWFRPTSLEPVGERSPEEQP
jgi:hypothetical protein